MFQLPEFSCLLRDSGPDEEEKFLRKERYPSILVSGFNKEGVPEMKISKMLFCIISAISITVFVSNAQAELSQEKDDSAKQEEKEVVSVPISRSGGSGMSTKMKFKRSTATSDTSDAGMASLNPESLAENKKQNEDTRQIPLSRSGGSQGSNNIEIKK